MTLFPLSDWLDDQVSALWDAGVCKKVEKPKKTNMQKVQVWHFVTRPTILKSLKFCATEVYLYNYVTQLNFEVRIPILWAFDQV